MPQPIDMGPQPEKSMLNTRKAIQVRFEMHNHDGVEGGPLIGIVYYPINDGVWMPISISCADCVDDYQLVAELKIVSRKIVDVR